MRMIKLLVPLTLCALLISACDYIVLPEDLEAGGPTTTKGWSAVVTSVGKTEAGDLHIELTLRNETGAWSAMRAADKPAVLTGGGKSTDCDTVFVGTGGHRLAPGFQMRGYTGGTKAVPAIQLIYVECKGAEAAPESKLSIAYSYVTGDYNYYYPETNKVDAMLDVQLDSAVTGLKYPVAEMVENLLRQPGAPLTAINNVVLTLTQVERTQKGLVFHWQTENPGEYPTYVHVGNPPVIGADGVIYGFYETPDIVSTPITPAGDKAEWTTGVAVPPEVKGLYILLPVETGKQRLFTYYAVDISTQ